MRALILAGLVAVSSGCFAARRTEVVSGTRVVTLQQDFINAHAIVGDEGHFVLVDSGLERNGQALERLLEESGLDLAKLDAVVLTHGHADHAGGARRFQQRGVKVVAGAGDVEALGKGANETLCPTDSTARGRLAEDQHERFSALVPDVPVTEVLALQSLSRIEGEVLPAPGHTPGSLVVRVKDALFVGDLLRGAILGSSAEVHFYMCDLEQNRQLVQSLLARWPSASTFFVGHFGPVSRAEVERRFGATAPRP